MIKKCRFILFLLILATALFGLSACEDQGETYYTEDGVSYTVKGETDVRDDLFVFDDELALTFSKKQFLSKFNRMTFRYTSDQPLHVYVKYKLGIINKKDDFYLTAGENVVFSGLISKYLRGKAAKEIRSVKVRSCTGEGAAFRLHSLSTERIDVCDDVCYLQNGRFSVGIRLGWGGGINYIVDKSCPVDGLGNLINDHDTGRLVQQSYYGTAGNDVYKPGRSNGTKWVYNPVQGGDKYNHASRLIDVVVTDTSVYVKAQPQDWSLYNKLTPSYMENTYELTENYVKVNNVFTDFSGWEHRYCGQELPAFYTVSYLNDFVWYDGNAPWTDDTLSDRADLQFWGDSAYENDCRITMKESNTETWCAWINKSTDYGIGLYVPNVDIFYAGKYEYNGSKSSSDNATNYVAPLDQIKIVSYEPIEYSYLITTGTTKQIRKTFTDNKDFTDNSSLCKNYQSMRVSD